MERVCFFEVRPGVWSLVDPEDYERLSRFPRPVFLGGQYAMQWYPKRRKVTKVAHIVTDAPPGATVDHLNGDRLDDRRSNLRVCTRAENLANRLENRVRRGVRTRWAKPRESGAILGLTVYGVRMAIRGGWLPEMPDELFHESALIRRGDLDRIAMSIALGLDEDIDDWRDSL